MEKVSLITTPVKTSVDGSYDSPGIRLNDRYDIVRHGHHVRPDDSGIRTDYPDFDTCEHIQIKKSDDLVIFMPMFDSDRTYIKNYYYSESTWYMTRKIYEQIRAINPEFPPFETIKQLTWQDCVEIFLYELPEPLFSMLKLNDLYLNTDAPEGKEIVKLLQRKLAEWRNSDEPVTIKPLEKENEITIILDTPDYYEWKPLYKTNDSYGLVLAPGYQVT